MPFIINSDNSTFSRGTWNLEDFSNVASSGVLAVNGGSTKTFTTDNSVGMFGLSGMNTAPTTALSGSSRFHMLTSSQLTQEASVGHKGLFSFFVPTFTTPVDMGYEIRVGLIDAPPNSNPVVNGVYVQISNNEIKMRIVNSGNVFESAGYIISRTTWYRIAYTITSSSQVVLSIYDGATNLLLSTLTANGSINAAVRYGFQLVGFCTTTPTAAQELIRYDYLHQFVPRVLPIPLS